MKIGFIGAGNMATAMIKGLLQSQFCQKEEIYISNRSQEKLDRFAGCHTSLDNAWVASQVGVLVLSIKPQMYKEVISTIVDSISKDALVISIAPNWTLENLEEYIGKHKIARCMPNTPAMVLEGMTGYVCNSLCDVQDKEILEGILSSFGQAMEVEEKVMNGVVAMSGSSPAYAFYFLEIMIQKGQEYGLTMEQAKLLAAQSFKGAAQLVLESSDSAKVLKEKVCSPGGTTIEAIHIFENKGLESMVSEAMDACKEKAGRMKV